MTLICFSSQKGSPGATATALAVAASLKVAKGRRKVLLEADATGGTLAIRYQLPVEPGLLTLAAAVRGGLDSSEGLWRHAQELPGGLPVIVCPDGPEQVHAAMAAGGAQLGRFLNSLRDVDVMCDVGRLGPDSPALPFVAEASAVLMVARPTAEQLQPAARRMLMLRPLVSNLGWVLVGQKPYGPADVESTYEFPVVGVMADDPRSVTSLERGTVSKRLRRQPFIRSATTLAGTLSSWLAPMITPTATSVAESAQSSEVSLPSPEPVPKPGPVVAPTAAAALNSDVPALPETVGVGLSPESPVDLSLLPPPTGEPDPPTQHPEPSSSPAALNDPEAVAGTELEPWPEPAGGAVLPPQMDWDEGAPPEPDLVDWDEQPPVEPEPPRLISAPLQEPPQDEHHRLNPIDDPDAETTVFPPDAQLLDLPPPPPPAPVGERPLRDVEIHQNGLTAAGVDGVDGTAEQAAASEPEVDRFGDVDVPNGLTWSDIEPDHDPSVGAESGTPQLEEDVEPDAVDLNDGDVHAVDLRDPDLPPDDPQPDDRDPDDEHKVIELAAVPPVPPPSMALPADELDSWDGSEFTVTADLDKVFFTPDFDAGPIAQDRELPPMPPIPSIPPLPPPSTQLAPGQNGDRDNPPSPFPHEETDPEGTGW